jgi:UDP-galactopyranose mutase
LKLIRKIIFSITSHLIKFIDGRGNKNQESTIISYEYPASYEETNDPYYPINDQNNNEIYQKYKKALEFEKNILISGRLGKYKYIDMDDCIALAIKEASCFQATAD